MNSTFLALIAKVVGALDFTQYCPISLCNSLLKILTKTLANRLKLILPSIIAFNQGGFVKGRLIFDGIISIHEVIHSMDKSNEAGMILKLDMNKAYNRVSWVFLEKNLVKFGFNREWVDLVMKCASSTWFSILLNGAATSFLKSNRGLRQGDPLSQYLFIILAKALGRNLTKAVEDGKVEGFKPTSSIEPLSHLQFANDTLIVTKASLPKENFLEGILLTYEEEAGQKINIAKSKVFFLNTPELRSRCIARALGYSIGSLPNSYLALFQTPIWVYLSSKRE
eukprot:Gb_27956 [translate_table: standard]